MWHRAFLATTALAVVFLQGQTASAGFVEDAMDTCRHGEPNARVVGCETVINYSRDRRALIRAHNTRGLALCNLDRCAEAVDDFNELLRLDSSIAGYFDNRAKALRAAKRFSEAIADSDHAIRMAPTYAFVYLGKAHAYEDQNRFGEALAITNQSLRVEPTNAGIYEYRGKLFGLQGDYAQAYADYGRALELEPSRVNVYKTRASTEIAQGRDDEASADLDKVPADGEGVSEMRQVIASHVDALRAARAEAQLAEQEKVLQAARAEAARQEGVRLEAARQEGIRQEAERQDRLREAARQREEAIQREVARREAARRDEENSKQATPVQVAVTLANPIAKIETTPTAEKVSLSKEDADRLAHSLGEVKSQIEALKDSIAEQKKFKSSSDGDVSTIDETISLISKQLLAREKQLDQGQKEISAYLTSIKPEDRHSYVTARVATQAFPRVPYYIPGTQETGEFWIEPMVNETGALIYQLRFVDPKADYNAVRDTISVTPSELADAQSALAKVRLWSVKAHEAGVRKVYSKRAACFPQADCPEDGKTAEGKASTEVRFNVYEDGSTAGRIQRNKGRYIEGYNISMDSVLLLGAYIAYAKHVAEREFNQGTQTKNDLDNLFH